VIIYRFFLYFVVIDLLFVFLYFSGFLRWLFTVLIVLSAIVLSLLFSLILPWFVWYLIYYHFTSITSFL
jgi:hypothetical protein